MKPITQEELRSIQIDMLDHISKFCDEHQIRYSLAFGTLLGAVRHKGFIPWDDDIDIMMLREDYNKFRSQYLDKNRSGRYQLIDHEIEAEYYMPFMKIHDTQTLFYGDNECGCEKKIGVWIDIFPIDRLPNNKCHAFLFFMISRYFFGKIIASYYWASQKKSLKSIFARGIAWVFSKKWLKKRYNFYSSFNSRTDFNTAANVFFWNFHGKRVPFTCYLEAELLNFEDRKYSAIKDYDTYLTALYGDYMTPPPVGQRRTHSGSPVWKN